MKRYRHNDVLRLLEKAVKTAGGQRAFATKAGVTGQYVSDVLRHRREPGGSILFALGLRKVTLYEPIQRGE